MIMDSEKQYFMGLNIRTVIVVVVITTVIIFLSSCHPKKIIDPRINYVNLDLIIVEKAGYVNSGGKYTTLGKYFLLQGVQDTALYWEFHGLNGYLSDSVYYNHKVGDWLHFDYVLKSHFFHITDKVKCSHCKK